MFSVVAGKHSQQVANGGQPAYTRVSHARSNEQGIEVLEVNFMESYYRAAGNPVVGFLGNGIGASFVMVSLFAHQGPRVRFATRAIMIWSIVSLVIILFSTLDQLAGVAR